MQLAIWSDSHDNIPNIQKALAYLKQRNITFMIHCGDLAAPAVIKKELGPNFNGEVHFIHGNVADRELNQKVAAEFKNITCHGDQGELAIDGKKIAFNHYPEEAKKLAETGKYDVVFYGHNHIPWEETIGQTKLLNPGTLAGMFAKATFAVYDTKTNTAELILLEKI
ncbi:MAG: metallophosphoesterase family protein [Candidatus Buchananbacteria bacterium]|nr:metallophosphoesterase family protein [Candidatus Buchananbacteria bacterium]